MRESDLWSLITNYYCNLSFIIIFLYEKNEEDKGKKICGLIRAVA